MDRGANARMARADRPARHVRPASHPWEGRTWVGRAAPPCSCLSVQHDRIEEIGSLDRLAGDARHPRPTTIHPLTTAGRSPSLRRIWRLAAGSDYTSASRRTSAASAQSEASRQADGHSGLALAKLLVADCRGAGAGSAARTGATPSPSGGISAFAGTSTACRRHPSRSACQAGQPAAADVRAAYAGGTGPSRECWRGRPTHRRSPSQPKNPFPRGVWPSWGGAAATDGAPRRAASDTRAGVERGFTASSAGGSGGPTPSGGGRNRGRRRNRLGG